MHGALSANLVVRQAESGEFPFASDYLRHLDGLTRSEFIRIQIQLLQLVVILEYLPEGLNFFQSNLAVVECE